MTIIRYLSPNGEIKFAAKQPNGRRFDLAGDIFSQYEITQVESVISKILAPIEPPAILCIGINYKKHGEEQRTQLPQWPMLFIKSPNTLNHPDDPIELPVHLPSEKVDYEAELAVVIGKKCKNASRKTALDYVLGYTAANDVSARDWQKQWGGGQFCRGKSFDTFAPLGPGLVTADEIPDPQTLRITSKVNGEIRQDAHTSEMIFDVATLIEFLSGSTTLLPGTIILTGTPGGVGMAMDPPRYLGSGDIVEVEIEKIGKLTNPVIRERVQ
jgi:2-keto-4-pentenoate hydratase/2-oxohepta-3-ene-1,7-dioic acid hydratase in catechol pathway